MGAGAKPRGARRAPSRHRLRGRRCGSRAAAGASPRGAALSGGEAGQCKRRTLALAAKLPTSGRAKRGLWRPLRGSPRVRRAGTALFHSTAVKQGAPAVGRGRKVGQIFKGGERHRGGAKPQHSRSECCPPHVNRGPHKVRGLCGEEEEQRNERAPMLAEGRGIWSLRRRAAGIAPDRRD